MSFKIRDVFGLLLLLGGQEVSDIFAGLNAGISIGGE
jgi:hypothetical protein